MSDSYVAPHAGAWIETESGHVLEYCGDGSLPMRERGLKHAGHGIDTDQLKVAPHAGAWIETLYSDVNRQMARVAPHAGAWIETGRNENDRVAADVAPHAGAWIETLWPQKRLGKMNSRSPCGSVD